MQKVSYQGGALRLAAAFAVAAIAVALSLALAPHAAFAEAPLMYVSYKAGGTIKIDTSSKKHSECVSLPDSWEDLAAAEVVSSNPKVASVEAVRSVADETLWRADFYVKGKKPGTAKVTMKATFQNGTKKTYKTTVKVYKYKNPIKSLKVNGKQYKSAFKNDHMTYKVVKSLKPTQKIVFQPASGWKLLKTGLECWAKDADYAYKYSKSSKLTIKYPTNPNQVTASARLKNKKTGQVQFVYLNLLDHKLPGAYA